MAQAQEENCTGPLSMYKDLAKKGFCTAIFTDITPAQAHIFLSYLTSQGVTIKQQYPAKAYTDNKYSVMASYIKDDVLYTISCVYLDLGGVTGNKRGYDFLLRVVGLSDFIGVSDIKFIVTITKEQCEQTEKDVKDSDVSTQDITVQDQPKEVNETEEV